MNSKFSHSWLNPRPFGFIVNLGLSHAVYLFLHAEHVSKHDIILGAFTQIYFHFFMRFWLLLLNQAWASSYDSGARFL